MLVYMAESREEKNTALGASGADSELETCFPRFMSCPPAGGIKQAQLGELILQQSWDDCVENRGKGR